MFSWIPIHKEAVRKMLGLSEPQTELLAVVREMQERGLTVIGLTDRGDADSFPLREIDPLTFLASFNRGISEENRRENWRFLKAKWNLSENVPDDFDGIPTVNNQNSWFFAYAKNRKKDDIDLLWQLVQQTVERPLEEIDGHLFDRCSTIRALTIRKLTIGLYWINPMVFLPCDKKTSTYAQHHGVVGEPQDFASYSAWLRQAATVLGRDFPRVSHDAHVWAAEQGVSDADEDPSDTESQVPGQHRFWIIAPGRKAKRWVDFYSEGIVAIGWDELRDLTKFTDKEGIQRAIQEHPENEGSSKKNDALACWQFAHVMQPGDVVFAKKGLTKILGHAIVRGEYRYDAHRDSYRHLRKVDWLSKGEWTVSADTQLPQKTLTDISKDPKLVEEISVLLGLDPDAAVSVLAPEPSATVAVAASSRRSYWWLNANPKMWNFEDAAVGERQTYTSHNENGNKRQKYRYFQEVKPGDLMVGYVTSPQREIVGVCRITQALHQSQKGDAIEFEKIERLDKPVLYETLKANPDLEQCEPLGNHQGSLFHLTEEEYEVIRTLIDEVNPPAAIAPKPYTRQMALDGLFVPEGQFDDSLSALREKKNIVLQGPPGVGKTFVARRLAKALIGLNDSQRIEMIQFHQSYSYEDFIQGFRPTSKGTFELKFGIFHQFCRRAQRHESAGQPYVFIIDEINRGNLSKILGELMMLIEADKRGKEFAIPLAYSEDPEDVFYIPSNLYLIGTMNTADRSLAMVDYALRRRFRFITLNPEFSSSAFRVHLEECGIDGALAKRIVTNLTALNELISGDTKNLGSGYQIGHSYFCPQDGTTPDENWYRRVIESEVVPLIREYWSDDEKKVEERRSLLLS